MHRNLQVKLSSPREGRFCEETKKAMHLNVFMKSYLWYKHHLN